MERKKILLRLDPVVHDALAKWAADDLRSTNAQIEFLLRRALSEAGRMPGGVGQTRPRGRPRKNPEEPVNEPAEDGETADKAADDTRDEGGAG
ncbi:hypothetical protein [Sinosporangium siamense]|uniref:Toxin-antitoxin system HicB family antitoxin n=1 Tax=Sinosporangium siamense TaxID=1367973 RepID=A0A919RL90_9ACTN|nr:hypothetical protein [Sinosporangium siamense]GII94166.1 hypothetical protein Ssi02_43970 [Sinosporangium siamense]